MTFRRRIESLESKRPMPTRSDGRRRLAAFIDTVAARRHPSDDERAEAQQWLASEWPSHLKRLRDKLAAKEAQ